MISRPRTRFDSSRLSSIGLGVRSVALLSIWLRACLFDHSASVSGLSLMTYSRFFNQKIAAVVSGGTCST
jgi:hypothetical protein